MVVQYWHSVTTEAAIEHRVLGDLPDMKWSVFKKPYNFHLKLSNIQEVSFARGSTVVIVAHKRGGPDRYLRGDVMAQFKRERTKKRFLTFLGEEKGFKVTEVGV